MNKKGKYTMFISAVKTPTGRQIAVYVPALDKTYVIAAMPRDDDDDLSTHAALLLLRKKVKTYNGLYIPRVETEKGSTIIK